MIYENDDDLRSQREVMSDVLHWFQSLPAVGGNGQGFTSKEIPTVEGESTPDYQLWWNHICVGVVEIKCRSVLYDSWLIGRPKLEMLFKNYQSKGIPALLVCAHVVDGLPSTIDVADLRDLIANKDQWKEAPSKASATTDHGKQERKPEPSFLLPRTLFWNVT